MLQFKFTLQMSVTYPFPTDGFHEGALPNKTEPKTFLSPLDLSNKLVLKLVKMSN